MASVADEEPLAPVAYALTFLVSIIMVKSLIALAFDRTRAIFPTAPTKPFFHSVGLAMIVFATGFMFQAYDLYSAL